MSDVRVRRYTRRYPVRQARAQEHKRQRGLMGAMVGPEELEALQRKLKATFQRGGWSPKMVAISGYILDARWTSPQIDEVAVTSDGFVMASNSNDVGMNMMLGARPDLQRNWEALLDEADLTFDERANAERLFMVKVAG